MSATTGSGDDGGDTIYSAARGGTAAHGGPGDGGHGGTGGGGHGGTGGGGHGGGWWSGTGGGSHGSGGTGGTGVICFTPGVMVATPKGERAVEELGIGDRVITRDDGIQEIRWIGHKSVDWKELRAEASLRPVLIRKGALGNDLPERDMMVSQNHRMLVMNDRTSLYFEEREVLVAAKHLVGNRGVHQVESMGATYIHVMFDRHEIILANGAWTESFHPGDYSLKGLGNAQRNEIYDLFPELKLAEGLEDYAAARKILRKHEARLLF